MLRDTIGFFNSRRIDAIVPGTVIGRHLQHIQFVKRIRRWRALRKQCVVSRHEEWGRKSGVDDYLHRLTWHDRSPMGATPFSIAVPERVAQ